MFEALAGEQPNCSWSAAAYRKQLKRGDPSAGALRQCLCSPLGLRGPEEPW